MKVVEYWHGTIKNYRYDEDVSSFMETFIAAATRIADGIDLDEFVEPASPPLAE